MWDHTGSASALFVFFFFVFSLLSHPSQPTISARSSPTSLRGKESTSYDNARLDTSESSTPEHMEIKKLLSEKGPDSPQKFLDKIVKLSTQLAKLAESDLTATNLERMKSLHAQISVLLRDVEVEATVRAKKPAEESQKRRRHKSDSDATKKKFLDFRIENPTQKRPKRSETTTCASCFTASTPEWRLGPEGATLCNACGLRYQKTLKREGAKK